MKSNLTFKLIDDENSSNNEYDQKIKEMLKDKDTNDFVMSVLQDIVF